MGEVRAILGKKVKGHAAFPNSCEGFPVNDN